MARPLWNSMPDVHGESRMPNSELTAPRTGQREGSAATALPARDISRSSAGGRGGGSDTQPVQAGEPRGLPLDRLAHPVQLVHRRELVEHVLRRCATADAAV